MKHPILSLALVLGLAAPAVAAQAHETRRPSYPTQAQRHHRPRPAPSVRYQAPPARPRVSYTPVRVTPPLGGEVIFYDGPQIMRRVDRPTSFTVLSGRAYATIALRGGAVIWRGSVQASGNIIDLAWPEPVYTEAPWWDRIPLLPHEQYALLVRLDWQRDDFGRLEVLQAQARGRAFSVAQIDQILPRFQFEHHRVQALAVVRDRILDRENSHYLVRHFQYEGSRRDAIQLLGLGYR